MALLARDGSLAVLADATNAAASGAGQVVLVAGEAGIGKTALVSQFVYGREAAHRAMWGCATIWPSRGRSALAARRSTGRSNSEC